MFNPPRVKNLLHLFISPDLFQIESEMKRTIEHEKDDVFSFFIFGLKSFVFRGVAKGAMQRQGAGQRQLFYVKGSIKKSFPV